MFELLTTEFLPESPWPAPQASVSADGDLERHWNCWMEDPDFSGQMTLLHQSQAVKVDMKSRPNIMVSCKPYIRPTVGGHSQVHDSKKQ